jgi:hypothetical protein
LIVTRTDGQIADAGSSTAVPMNRLVSMQQPPPDERYVERFEARDIVLDDESMSLKDVKPSVHTDDKSESYYVPHAK